MKILFAAQHSTVRNNSVCFGTTDEEYQQQLRKYQAAQQQTLDELLQETKERLKTVNLDTVKLSPESKKLAAKLKL